jgi:hypothetical protein
LFVCKKLQQPPGFCLILILPINKYGFFGFLPLFRKDASAFHVEGRPIRSAKQPGLNFIAGLQRLFEFLEEERQALGDWWFRQEYFCEFVETVDQVFSYDQVMAAITEEVEPLFGGVEGV